jgi:hypothetical protein
LINLLPEEDTKISRKLEQQINAAKKRLENAQTSVANAQTSVANAQSIVDALTAHYAKLLSASTAAITLEKGIVFCPFFFVFLLRQTPNTDFLQKKKNLTTKSQRRVTRTKKGLSVLVFLLLF